LSKKSTFEDDMARLEAIVAKLERNELGLDESLKAFEEGMKLAESLAKALEKAEARVQQLVKGIQGELGLEDFEGDDITEEG
jgi:exodeoxyribonuclease VII small subunit